MITSVLAAAVIGVGSAQFHGGTPMMYDPNRDPRPIAELPGPPINGRLWVSRPTIGPGPGPFFPQLASPGPEYYGALDNIDARVPVRVGHIVVTISAWEQIDQRGLRQFEDARQFWLRENNYTGGVRTFINDRHLWATPGDHARHSEVQSFDNPAARQTGHPLPLPRATIQVPEDTPRKRPPLRVQGNAAPEALVLLSDQPVRISWPHATPARPTTQASAR